MPITRIYTRMSTEKQSRSPARQAIFCREYHALTPTLPPLMEQVYHDNAKSGVIPFDSRPAGHALLIDCQRLDHLIVDAYDRLGRDVPDMIQTVRLFAKRGVVVHILNMLILSRMDPDDPLYELMLTQLASISQMERKTISNRTKRGIAARRMQGYGTGNATPIGFKQVPNPEFDVDKCRASHYYSVPRKLLVPYPEEQDYWDQAWMLYVNGAKIPEIKRRMKDHVCDKAWPSRRLWRRLTQKKKELEAEAFRQERSRTFGT